MTLTLAHAGGPYRPTTFRRPMIALLIWLLIGVAPNLHAAPAEGTRSRFFEAEKCQRELTADAQRQKYRHHWLRCIDRFDAVYSDDPDGKWAAAGLYRAGVLYLDLARRSGSAGDRQEGIDRLERVVRRFPSSAYRPQAESLLGGSRPSADAPTAKTKPSPKVPQKTEAIPKTTPEDPKGMALCQAADRCYARLQKNPRRTKHRDVWLTCIEKYRTVFRHNPTGPLAPQGLYMAAKLYRELAGYSFLPADRTEAIEQFRHLAVTFAGSPYALQAEKDLAQMGVTLQSSQADAPPKPAAGRSKSDDRLAALIAAQPAETSGPKRSGRDPDAGEGPATVSGLRFWSNPNYTRVVVDVDGVTEYRHHLLKKDPGIDKPQRLFIDLAGSRLGQGLQRQVPINDDLLLDARAGQYDADTVRVVVDIKSFKTYKLFSLRNPFRIVIDVWGEGGAMDVAAATPTPPTPHPSSEKVETPDAGSLPPGALAKQLALGVRRIIIDPGHGGKDYGAPGYIKGVHEKNLTLDISKRLAAMIRQRLGCEVIMTRETDRYLTLEERTAIANTRNADLFISVHTNAARDQRAYGIETFFLNLATDNESILVAARENATSEKNISDLQTILLDLMQNAKINESSRLAGYVQKTLHSYLQSRYSQIRSKGVKQAPFYVLLGAQMPAILVETSFISNARECKRLIDPAYQEHVCEGIVKGVEVYIRETNPTALMQFGERKG